MTRRPDGPGDLDARAASRWVATTGAGWALAPIAVALLFVVDAAFGHIAAATGGVAVVATGLGVLLSRRGSDAPDA